MQTEQIVAACLAARAELERLESAVVELPPEVKHALGHLNRYLFDHDCEVLKNNMDYLLGWLGAPYAGKPISVATP